jgi:hypothetical protein
VIEAPHSNFEPIPRLAAAIDYLATKGIVENESEALDLPSIQFVPRPESLGVLSDHQKIRRRHRSFVRDRSC